MARIYTPKQRQNDQRWDFTVSSDDEGWARAEGYCSAWLYDGEPNAGTLVAFGGRARYDAHVAALAPYRAKYHADGHATAEEASACYHEYILDQRLHFIDTLDEQRRCDVEGCETWTTGRARVGVVYLFTVCEAHRTRDAVAVLLEERRDAIAWLAGERRP